jgi:membrane protein involved in colicin uptake
MLMKGSYLFKTNMIISWCYSNKTTRAEKAKAFSKTPTRAAKAKAREEIAQAREEEIAKAEEYVDNVVKQLSKEKPKPCTGSF